MQQKILSLQKQIKKLAKPQSRDNKTVRSIKKSILDLKAFLDTHQQVTEVIALQRRIQLLKNQLLLQRTKGIQIVNEIQLCKSLALSLTNYFQSNKITAPQQRNGRKILPALIQYQNTFADQIYALDDQLAIKLQKFKTESQSLSDRLQKSCRQLHTKIIKTNQQFKQKLLLKLSILKQDDSCQQTNQKMQAFICQHNSRFNKLQNQKTKLKNQIAMAEKQLEKHQRVIPVNHSFQIYKEQADILTNIYNLKKNNIFQTFKNKQDDIDFKCKWIGRFVKIQQQKAKASQSPIIVNKKQPIKREYQQPVRQIQSPQQKLRMYRSTQSLTVKKQKKQKNTKKKQQFNQQQQLSALEQIKKQLFQLEQQLNQAHRDQFRST